MNQRKDTYRAALQRRPDATAPASASASTSTSTSTSTKVTRLDTRYVKVVIELDLAFARDLTGWAGKPLSALVRAGEAVLRPLRQEQ